MPRVLVHKLIFDGGIFYVHENRIPEGYEGYVIHDGTFYCSLPIMETRQEFLEQANNRIRDLIFTYGPPWERGGK